MSYFPLQVSIPEPCSENWDAMTQVDDQRRHCATCDKTLTDFTCMTDRQIGHILRANGGNLCGRFRRSQLDRPLRLKEPRRRRGLGAIAASAGLLLAAPAFGQGVAPEPTVRVETKAEKIKTSAPGQVTIKGTVTDQSGEPLIGVSVLIVGTTVGAVTDIDGRFSLRVPDNELATLRLSYVGFASLEITYLTEELADIARKSDASSTQFVLEESATGLVGIIVAGYVKKSSLLDNLMVHAVKPIYEAPDYSHRTKSGDWKDYWRDLFARRKARRAERRAARQARKAVKEAARLDVTEVDEVVTPQTGKQDLVRETFNLQASPNPFDQELRVSFLLPEAQVISLALLDATGRVVIQEKHRLQAGAQVIVLRQRLGSLNAGTYLLRLQGKKNGQETIRLIR